MVKLPYSVLVLEFHFPFSCRRVFEWWTELEPRGYVGRRLKRIEVLERSGRGARVLTYWRFMGFGFKLLEELEVKSEGEWVWRSRFLGVPAVETFQLTTTDGSCMLRITSVMNPPNIFRKMLFLLVGWYWRAEDKKEWVSAAEACIEELTHT
ncbi:MAG: hypothetical protein QXH56_02075 [Thermoprotei archaeon]